MNVNRYILRLGNGYNLRHMRYSFLILLSLLCTTSLFAGPTMTGSTGLITMPTAESLKYKEYNIAVDYNWKSTAGNEQHFYKANLGTFKGWELGVVGGSVPTQGVFVNAKYYLMSDNERYPLSVAIGVENLTSQYLTNVYMVASKKFEHGWNGHFGFRANFGEEEIDPSIMVGLEYMLNNQLSLLADVTGARRLYTVNAGVRYYLSQELVFRLSVLNANRDDGTTEGENPYYSIGLSYSGFL